VVGLYLNSQHFTSNAQQQRSHIVVQTTEQITITSLHGINRSVPLTERGVVGGEHANIRRHVFEYQASNTYKADRCFRRVRQIEKRDYAFRYECLSVGFQWTDFYYISLWRKYNFSLKYDKNSGYFIWRLIHIMISRWILLRNRKFSDKIVEKIKIHILRSKPFFTENLEVYGKI
jgi:hypothetical protein